MKRLLFLFSDTGAGHRAAAEAVAAALALRYPNRFQVDCFDPMADPHVLAGRLTALYGPVTRRLPFLWSAAYHATNLQPTVRLFQHSIGRGLRRKLRAALDPRPALVASFHPLLNHVAVDVLPYGVPRVTVITDWINFHQAWTDLKADCIICPSQAAYDLCRRRGVPADRLVRAGLPIHPRFQDAIRHASDKPSMRLRLRLRPHAPTVLLAADLLATRAGPGMIAEGLSCGCPLLLTGYLPGQEGGNVSEVVRRGLGRYVPRPNDLVGAVNEWFEKPQAERLADADRARAAADPTAAFTIADVLVRMSG